MLNTESVREVFSKLKVLAVLSSLFVASCGVSCLLFFYCDPERLLTFSSAIVHPACGVLLLVPKVAGCMCVGCVVTQGLIPVLQADCQPGGSGIITRAGNLVMIWTEVTLTSS